MALKAWMITVLAAAMSVSNLATAAHRSGPPPVTRYVGAIGPRNAFAFLQALRAQHGKIVALDIRVAATEDTHAVSSAYRAQEGDDQFLISAEGSGGVGAIELGLPNAEVAWRHGAYAIEGVYRPSISQAHGGLVSMSLDPLGALDRHKSRLTMADHPIPQPGP